MLTNNTEYDVARPKPRLLSLVSYNAEPTAVVNTLVTGNWTLRPRHVFSHIQILTAA
jgi:hypothetical protein